MGKVELERKILWQKRVFSVSSGLLHLKRSTYLLISGGRSPAGPKYRSDHSLFVLSSVVGFHTIASLCSEHWLSFKAICLLLWYLMNICLFQGL